MDDKIKRVRELDRELAPGPWAVRGCDKHADCTGLMCYRIRDANGVPVDGANKEGLVACRNLAPALADELEAARKENEKLRADLKAAWFEADVEKECHESTDAMAAKNIAEVQRLETQFLDARSALAAERARAEKAEAELAKEREMAKRLEESMRTLAEQISANTHPDEVQISSPARHLMGQRILLGLDQWQRES